MNKNLGLFSRKAVLFSLLLPLSVAIPQQSMAQEQDDDSVIEEIITTGTRSRERSVSESMVPIDVISAEDFSNQGDTDLSNLLRCGKRTPPMSWRRCGPMSIARPGRWSTKTP